MLHFRQTLFLLLIITGTLLFAQDKTLRMGYRTTPKLPLIEESPNNDGLYYDLFSEACRRLGFTLEVVRKPKKRIEKGLEDGSIDFYPVYIFTSKRAKYCYFIPTGMKDKNVGVSLATLDEVRTFKDLDGLTYLQPLGNANYLENINTDKIKIHETAEIALDRIFLMLQHKRADFMIYQKSTIQYFLKSNKIKGIKLHENLLPDVINLPLGFSLKSPHCQYIENKKYDSSKEVSIDNFPYILDETSTAFKLKVVLEELANEGFTDSLYKKYYE